MISTDQVIPLMLLMITRSNVTNLMSNLQFMRYFAYFFETVTGEYGYTLSSFEAVLAFVTEIQQDPQSSLDLRQASDQCRQLWEAIAVGNLDLVRHHLRPVQYLFEFKDLL